MFFVGNNDDTSGYGPDRFCFVGPEFRIYNNTLTPPGGTHGKAVLDNVAGQIESSVPSFMIESSGNVGIGIDNPKANLQIHQTTIEEYRGK